MFKKLVACSRHFRVIRHLTKMDKYNVVFVLGAPGSGKGTQCQRIVEEFGYTHFSTGGLIRAEKELEELLKEHVKNGTMVPVEISMGLLEKAMKKTRTESNKNNFLIDGFPRNLDNRMGWEKHMGDKTNLQYILFLDCPEETCIDRCLGRGAAGSGRPDDTIDILKIRMKTYQELTMPVIDHYKKLGLLRQVDAGRDANEVFEDIRKVFAEIQE